MFYEPHNIKESNNDSETYYSAVGETEIVESFQMVTIWDLEARSCPGFDAETVFIKCPKGKPSLELKIIWEDKTFK